MYTVIYKTMTTYTRPNYSIVSSLNERTIYFKITDTVTFYQYETNVDIKELRLTIELEDAYTIISRCFEEVDGSVTISVQSNVMKLQFKTLVGGFLKIEFDVLLREKISDDQIRLHMIQLEQQLIAMKKQVVELNNTLVGAYIRMDTGNEPTFVPLNNTKLSIREHHHPCSVPSGLAIVEKLHHLTHLTLENFKYTDSNTAKLCSTSLQSLTINCNNYSQTECFFPEAYRVCFSSVKGIEKLPKLEEITITFLPSGNTTYSKEMIITSITETLAVYQHKIKRIQLSYCMEQISNTLNYKVKLSMITLKTYCQMNKIIFIGDGLF